MGRTTPVPRDDSNYKKRTRGASSVTGARKETASPGDEKVGWRSRSGQTPPVNELQWVTHSPTTDTVRCGSKRLWVRSRGRVDSQDLWNECPSPSSQWTSGSRVLVDPVSDRSQGSMSVTARKTTGADRRPVYTRLLYMMGGRASGVVPRESGVSQRRRDLSERIGLPS